MESIKLWPNPHPPRRNIRWPVKGQLFEVVWTGCQRWHHLV